MKNLGMLVLLAGTLLLSSCVCSAKYTNSSMDWTKDLEIEYSKELKLEYHKGE